VEHVHLGSDPELDQRSRTAGKSNGGTDPATNDITDSGYADSLDDIKIPNLPAVWPSTSILG
jgi:hypothetical protein